MIDFLKIHVPLQYFIYCLNIFASVPAGPLSSSVDGPGSLPRVPPTPDHPIARHAACLCCLEDEVGEGQLWGVAALSHSCPGPRLPAEGRHGGVPAHARPWGWTEERTQHAEPARSQELVRCGTSRYPRMQLGPSLETQGLEAQQCKTCIQMQKKRSGWVVDGYVDG